MDRKNIYLIVFLNVIVLFNNIKLLTVRWTEKIFRTEGSKEYGTPGKKCNIFHFFGQKFIVIFSQDK